MQIGFLSVSLSLYLCLSISPCVCVYIYNISGRVYKKLLTLASSSMKDKWTSWSDMRLMEFLFLEVELLL